MPTGPWLKATGNLTDIATNCENLTYLSSKPEKDLLIAGIGRQGLWASDDGGETWSQMGTGKGSQQVANLPTAIIYDPADSNRFWEAGIYNGGGVYSTDNDGKTFRDLGGITHIDSVSVDFSGSDRNTLLASEHERRQAFLLSQDGGDTWQEMGQYFPAEAKFCSYPLVLDAQTFLFGCGVTLSGDGLSGIYKSTDAGNSWTSVSRNQGGASQPLRASDGSMYWVTEFGGGMVRSTDQGDTWTTVVGNGVINNFAPSELPDGRIAVMSGRHVLLSKDHGATFRIATADLSFDPGGFLYSPFQKAFYAWHAGCSSSVPSDAVVRYDFDYETETL